MLKSQTKLSFVHMNVSWTTRLTLKWLISVLKMLLPLSATDHVKYLGVLLDSNLSWKFHINNVALKVSRTVSVVARLRRFFPHINLLNIYQSLILPYLTYGLAAWGQAAKLPIYKTFSCFKNESFVWGIFLKPRRHALPLFICSKILPLQILYAEKGSSIMFDVSCLMLCLTSVISLLKLIQSTSMRPGFLRPEVMSNLQDWIKIEVLFPSLELNLGTRFPTNFVNSPKLLKKYFRDLLLSIMEAEDDFVEVPILLQNIANSAATT